MPLSRRLLILGLAATLVARASSAAEPATPEEAKALAEKAADHFRAVGPERAIADFNNPNGDFVDRELAVIVYAPDNTCVASGTVRVFLGKDATTFKDVEGNEFGKAIIDLARTKGSGWVEYRMTNPVTRKVARKRSWVLGLDGYVLFVGAFES